MGHDLNEKIFMQIVVLQIIAMRYLDDQFIERLRFRQKNEFKVLYRQVLQNVELLKSFGAGKIGKTELQKKYSTIMTE